MKRAVVAVALVACAPTSKLAPIVGEEPIECGPPPVPEEDFDRNPSAAVILLPLPLSDPDCTTSALEVRTPVILEWRDQANVQVSQILATRRSTWTRDGDTCRVRLSIEHHGGGPIGRPGTLQPCGVELLSEAGASFAEIPVLLDSLTLDLDSVALTGPVRWDEAAVTGRSCDQPQVAHDALAVGVIAELRVSAADWRRLHAARPPVLAVRVAIQAD